jgi:phage-related protein
MAGFYRTACPRPKLTHRSEKHALADQSKTWSGATSTIKDSVMILANKAFQPLFAQLTKGAVIAANFLSAWANNSKAFADVTAAVSHGVTVVGQFISQLWNGGKTLSTVARAVQENKALFIALGVAILAAVSPITVVVGALIYFRRQVGQVIQWAMGIYRQHAGEASGTFGVIRTAVTETMTAFKSIISTVLKWSTAFWDRWGGVITATIGRAFSSWLQIIRGGFQIISGLFKLIAAVMRGDWSKAWDAIKQIARGGANVVVGVVRGAWNLVRLAFGAVAAAGKAIWTGLWNTLRDRTKSGAEAVVDFFKGLPGRIANAMSGLGKALLDQFSGAVKKVLNFLGIHSPSKVFTDIGHNMVAGLAQGIAGRMKSIPNLFGRLAGMAGSALGGLFGFGGGNFSTAVGGSIVELGRQMAAAVGWTGGQWNALRALWQNESGWNPGAQNPTSTAYGIAQFLDSTWSSVGARKTSDPAGQIAAGIRYIQQAYGTPARALQMWLGRSPHWYGSGLAPTVFSTPTLIGVGERGPETVSITPRNRAMPGLAGGGDVNVTIRIDGPITGFSPEGIAEAINDRVRQGIGELLHQMNVQRQRGERA